MSDKRDDSHDLPNDPWLKTKPVADYLNTSQQQIVRMCKRGDFKTTRIGTSWRVSRASVLEYVGAQSVN